MPEELPAGYFEKVGSNYEYYDTICIGPGWRKKGTSWFDTLNEMSRVDEINFFDVRTGSKDGKSYCNMDATDNIGRPFRFHSFGMEWHYPDPVVSNEKTMNVTAAKFFSDVLPRHCYITFWIRDDVWFTLRPHHCPSGSGRTGSLQYNAVAPSASSLITNGFPQGQNRWQWTGSGVKIPETSQIRCTLQFSEYGKELLREMDQIWPLDGNSNEPFGNCAQIECNIRGLRYSQMKGKYYK